MATVCALRELEYVPPPRWFIITQVVLRVVTVLCTVASIVVMATSGTSVLVGGIVRITARYYYSSALKYLMGVDAAVCALVFLSLVALYVIYKKQFKRNHLYILFLHDLIVMVLMISACGAATAIGYVAKHGQKKTFWFKICDTAEKFCLNVGISVALSYVAFVCLFALTIISSYKLMKLDLPQSNYDLEVDPGSRW